MESKSIIAVVGATGLVGAEIVSAISEVNLPFGQLRLFASDDSAGEIYQVAGGEIVVKTLSDDCFSGVDLAFFATSDEVAQREIPKAIASGARVIDNSAYAYRSPAALSLVAGINTAQFKDDIKLISNPLSLSSQIVSVATHVSKIARPKRLVACSYEAVSGAGSAGMDELWDQTLSIFNQREIKSPVFNQQIAFNVIPQIGVLADSGSTQHEERVRQEIRRILDRPDLGLALTCVRVPVMYGHGVALNIETESAISFKELVRVLNEDKTINLYADPAEFPTALNVAGTDDLHVGRIRMDDSVPHGVMLWIMADNVRWGAARNAVKIAKTVLANKS